MLYPIGGDALPPKLSQFRSVLIKKSVLSKLTLVIKIEKCSRTSKDKSFLFAKIYRSTHLHIITRESKSRIKIIRFILIKKLQLHRFTQSILFHKVSDKKQLINKITGKKHSVYDRFVFAARFVFRVFYLVETRSNVQRFRLN